MFEGYPRFEARPAGRPRVHPGSASVPEKPAVAGPDDWLALTTRLRVVMEDPRQLLSGAVTDYASSQLIAQRQRSVRRHRPRAGRGALSAHQWGVAMSERRRHHAIHPVSRRRLHRRARGHGLLVVRVLGHGGLIRTAHHRHVAADDRAGRRRVQVRLAGLPAVGVAAERRGRPARPPAEAGRPRRRLRPQPDRHRLHPADQPGQGEPAARHVLLAAQRACLGHRRPAGNAVRGAVRRGRVPVHPRLHQPVLRPARHDHLRAGPVRGLDRLAAGQPAARDRRVRHAG